MSTKISKHFLTVTLIVLNFSLIGNAANLGGYCLAIRGNGELEPAHWGALAQIVEKKGLPKAQAGGSSAAITMFLLDSIAANPLVNSTNTNFELQKNRGAFYIKMLQGISIYLASTPSAKFALDFHAQIRGAIDFRKDIFGILDDLANNKDFLKYVTEHKQEIINFKSKLESIILSRTSPYMRVIEEIISFANGSGRATPIAIASLQFYAQDLKDSILKLGSFDAQSDKNLFFREGIIDFGQLSLNIGEIANFLAGDGQSEPTKKSFEKLISECEPLSRGKVWLQVLGEKPVCQQYLNETLDSYFNDRNAQNLKSNRSRIKIGSSIPSFPTTSVLTGGAYREANDAMTKYHRNLDRAAADQFVISNPEEIYFGYWGPSEAFMINVEKNLRQQNPNDLKSKKFLSLGSGRWIDALSVSPAEPGLASFRRMTVGGRDAYSAGGWSDLHPTLVLKATGLCDSNIVYVTRKGGESIFGQGVAKRLLNLERDWSYLKTTPEETKKLNKKINNEGDANDMTTNWSNLYNVANPMSSYMKSVGVASEVLCTDWDSYDVFTQFNELILHSYSAPLLDRNARAELPATGYTGCK